jgi:YjgF/chorismate_mutase-like, putative endoribonuclease
LRRLVIGSLDRVETILKVLGMVNAVPEFTEHPKVIDGCSDLFVAACGEAGRPARSVGFVACRGISRLRLRRWCC